MKVSCLVWSTTALCLGILAAAKASDAEAEAICGILGVMNTTNLAPGTNPDNIRMYAEHPLHNLSSIQTASYWNNRKTVGYTRGYY